MNPALLPLRILQNRLGCVPRPSWCTYLVTYRCNARCQMCDSWRMKPGEEMTPAQVAAVFGKLGSLDVVRLTGGEPFLRPDLHEIAEIIADRSRPGVLHISTNGSFPQRAVELARRFAFPRRLRFMVSFDGLAAEHDRNRGRHVTFELALETVRRLAELRRTRGIEVSANHTVISPESMADNAGLQERLRALGVEVHSVLAYSDSAMYGLELRGRRAAHLVHPSRYPLRPQLTGADVIGFARAELSRAVHYQSALLRWGKRYYWRGLLRRLEPRNAQQSALPPQSSATRRQPSAVRAPGAAGIVRRPRCVALRSHIRVLPDGSVPVCQFNTQRVGDLVAHSLAELWHGAAARSARRWVDRCPGCWAECEVIPSALYSGDIFCW